MIIVGVFAGCGRSSENSHNRRNAPIQATEQIEDENLQKELDKEYGESLKFGTLPKWSYDGQDQVSEILKRNEAFSASTQNGGSQGCVVKGTGSCSMSQTQSDSFGGVDYVCYVKRNNDKQWSKMKAKHNTVGECKRLFSKHSHVKAMMLNNWKGDAARKLGSLPFLGKRSKK